MNLARTRLVARILTPASILRLTHDSLLALLIPALILPGFLFLSTTLSRAALRDYAVEVSATVQESPPRIDFTWVADETAEEYRIFKKSVDDTEWTGPIAVLDGSATSFSDAGIAVGEAYEYSFRKTPRFIRDTVAVASGTPVTFTIEDTWGDGICCANGLGSFTVTGCEVMYDSGGTFGSSKSTSFTVGTLEAPCSEIVVGITLDIFGQETTWSLVEDASGDTLGRGGPYSAPKYGHIFAGISYPAPESMGTVLLLVDEPVAAPLATEIERLELDLICEGYGVRRLEVPDATPVPSVKDLILTECQADPDISTLFLLGNVAVPYSGDVRGAHSNHFGAWPADVYYGELDAVWTDSIVNNTTASRTQNHNVPGDGKFDQTFLPSDVDLLVGRVDLSNMPTFPEDEVTLLRRYLDKNHAFRTGQWNLTRRGRINDNCGELLGTAYGCVGWRNFTAMFGPGPTRMGDWFPTLETRDYLFAFGCGGGSYTSCAGVATTTDFATKTFYGVFTLMMGSYFGDWDSSNNLLRAALACEGYPLTSCWAGRPAWQLHHMALGYPIGYSTRITQNNHTLYMIGYGCRQIHIALMGDPTLKMHPFDPPGDLRLTGQSGGSIRLAWDPPDSSVAGYYVYRSENIREGFERVNPELVTDTVYVDSSPIDGWDNYMVRPVRLETTGSGTYLNPGPGVIDSIGVSAGAGVRTQAETSLSAPNPFHAGGKLMLNLARPGRVVLKVYDAAGRLVRTLDAGRLASGSHLIEWDGRDSKGSNVQPGVYFCRLLGEDEPLNRKIVLMR
jgi:hypothetical protein